MSVAISWANKMQLAKCDIMVGFPKSNHKYSLLNNTPQFLGELCLTTGMSGIDQQFIHYIHPAAVVLIIVMISLLTRKSSRFTVIISRGIIHVICLLLLLSYTSIVSTSLLLMRSLTFHQIDKV